MADKSNAMAYAHELWHRVFFEVANEYPGIEAKHVYVDALCLYLVQDPSPFEVVVTCNLFGDIVTDLGAALQGGLGMAASANVHASDPSRVAMFEPVHGSAPPLAGKDIANPIASFLTVGMMLTHLGFDGEEAANRKGLRQSARRSAVHTRRGRRSWDARGRGLRARATLSPPCRTYFARPRDRLPKDPVSNPRTSRDTCLHFFGNFRSRRLSHFSVSNFWHTHSGET